MGEILSLSPYIMEFVLALGVDLNLYSSTRLETSNMQLNSLIRKN